MKMKLTAELRISEEKQVLLKIWIPLASTSKDGKFLDGSGVLAYNLAYLGMHRIMHLKNQLTLEGDRECFEIVLPTSSNCKWMFILYNF